MSLIQDFDVEGLAQRQRAALERHGFEAPV
jgi:hypothetical protein